ncbi:Smr/MutS family protein [Sphingosinicella sp.]|uniref:Smr/MutS family protein n=1 Tax=Sphingosinicella sp. TaxID=1917971 RepID=UPI0017EB6685|nr:Smr/MutS family protein [Sphingosinicella sp.]MBA4759737.1 Smr/MutS family protein [Sphingosinicella sp.]
MARRPEPPSEAEAALWAKVTASVRPLKARAAPPPETPRPRVNVRPQPVEAPAISRERAAAAPEDASLDGGWDRRIRKGSIEAERTVDLHGHTQDEAYNALSGALERAWRDDVRTLLVITGKIRPAGEDGRPRGVIAANFSRWAATPALRPFIAAIRPAHPRHGGGGAWYVILRRKR